MKNYLKYLVVMIIASGAITGVFYLLLQVTWSDRVIDICIGIISMISLLLLSTIKVTNDDSSSLNSIHTS